MANSTDRVELAETQPGEQACPLRIHHFLVWIAFASVGLAWMRFLFGMWLFLFSPMQLIQFVIPVILAAGLCTIAIFAIYWRASRRVRTTEPGEWAAIAAAVEFFPIIGSICFGYLTRLVGVDASNILFIVSFVVISVGLIIALCRQVLKANESRWWKAVYLFLVIKMVDPWFFTLLSVDMANYFDDLNFYTCWSVMVPCVLTVTMFIAVAADVGRRKIRRWTNWAGLGFYVALAFCLTAISCFQS